YAREEMQIEFRVEDTTRLDPLGGYAAVVRASPEAVIDMPAMPRMPKFAEIAHAEDVPGDYGIHPTFAHGGEFRLKLSIRPPGGDPFESTFALTVQDADPGRKPIPPRYWLKLTSEPKRPKAGEEVELRLVIPDRDQGDAPVMAFETVHEAQMHLIIVRKDLSHFAHEHPALTGGEFRLRYRFPSGGEYRLFADVAPKGAGGQVVMARLKVAGPEDRPSAAPTPECSAEMTTPSELPARKDVSIEFRIRDARGEAPKDLEPYLGAAGHLMLIHDDAELFVHSHPLEDAPPAGELHFLARLPKAGNYRGWLQFQRAGRVETVEIRVRARE
ncbi:MAG TPA: hypothetical protein VGF59_23015, partial [Bryobacteraceae bacterium]